MISKYFFIGLVIGYVGPIPLFLLLSAIGLHPLVTLLLSYVIVIGSTPLIFEILWRIDHRKEAK